MDYQVSFNLSCSNNTFSRSRQCPGWVIPPESDHFTRSAHTIQSCGIFEIPDLFLWSWWPEARAKTQDRRWAKSEPWWLLAGQAERPLGHYSLQLTQAAPAPAPHLALVTRNTLPAHGAIVRGLRILLLWYWLLNDMYQLLKHMKLLRLKAHHN